MRGHFLFWCKVPDSQLNLNFRYTRNGAVVFDTYATNVNTFILGLRFNTSTNTNVYRFLYSEPGQDTQGFTQYMDLEYIPAVNGGQPQLHWVVYSELSAAAGENPPQMPMDMILTKVP